MREKIDSISFTHQKGLFEKIRIENLELLWLKGRATHVNNSLNHFLLYSINSKIIMALPIYS